MSAPAVTAGGLGGRPLAAFLACSVIWGSTFLAIRLGNDALPPLWAACLRLGVASVLLTVITRLRGRALPTGAALRAAVAFGGLNFGLSFCLLYWGELYVPSGVTAVMYSTVPLSTAMTMQAMGLERATRVGLLAAGVAIVGVVTLFSSELRQSVPTLPLFGVLAAATLAMLSGVALKRGPRQDPLGANAVGAMVGFVVCLAASVLRREPHPLPTTAGALLPLAYLIGAGSIGAFVLFAWLVHQWPLTRVSFIAVVVPVIATALGAWVRHEPVTALSALGSGLVLLGVLLVMLADRGAAVH